MPDWLDFDQLHRMGLRMRGGATSSSSASPSSTRSSRSSRARRCVVIGGNLASSGDLVLWLVILSAAAGAIIGDNISFWIGHFVGEKTVKRVFGSEKWHKRLEWAERTLDERGAYIIIIARFIPGGRTAVTFSAGYVNTFPWRRFIVYDVIAGVVCGRRMRRCSATSAARRSRTTPCGAWPPRTRYRAVSGLRRRGGQALPAAPATPSA